MEKLTKLCPYCGEEIMATAKKCKYCGEWLEPTETAQENKAESVIAETENTIANNTTTNTTQSEDIQEEIIENEDELLDTGYGFSVSKKLTKRITYGLIAFAVLAFAFLGYTVFSDSQEGVTMSNMDGTWKELSSDESISRIYQFKKDGTFNEIASTTEFDEEGMKYSSLITGTWKVAADDILGTTIELKYNTDDLHVDGEMYQSDETLDEDNPNVNTVKQALLEKYESDNKATTNAENQGKVYGLTNLTLRNDTLFQNQSPVMVKTGDILVR